jgi:hypothetical protein
MKVSRWLVLAVFAAACSDRPAVDEARPGPEQPQPEATATTGEATESDEQAAAAARPQPRRPVESAAAKDERAAAQGAVTLAAQQANVNTDSAVLQDFNDRVKKYVDIHKDAAKGSAKQKESENPAEILAAQEALAAKIRAARSTAQHGDIFTAEIRAKFRRLLAPELKGEDGRDAKAVLKDDGPSPAQIPFKVNAKYPEGVTRPTVPSNLLLNLPTLPEQLEYRIAGKHLVLLDTGANIIVDYIPNAIK